MYAFFQEMLKVSMEHSFKKKQTLAVSDHIIFNFKINLIFVETFLEKYIYFTKKKDLLNFA